MKIRELAYDHPDAVKLTEEVQAEYVARYGSGDRDPLTPSHFAPPGGIYLVAYDTSGAPVASGGWRAQNMTADGYEKGDAEIKRMYVTPSARGQGLARSILAALEDSAREAGRIRAVLETGTPLPEALALYTSSGYVTTTAFGTYRGHPESRFFAKPL
ncbi:GNAT family N-acetyltransferase [Streptomyces iconiensis]|uniref:GNAT family N-acetyltransferase n=1 Tax=Streptomyces iconiensis TaxID=1384038 RepID=UPI003D2F8777